MECDTAMMVAVCAELPGGIRRCVLLDSVALSSPSEAAVVLRTMLDV